MEIGFAKMNENKCSFRGKCRKIRKTSPKHNLRSGIAFDNTEAG
jgi:hypothetical protein